MNKRAERAVIPMAAAKLVWKYEIIVSDIYSTLGVGLDNYRVEATQEVSEIAGIFKGWGNQSGYRVSGRIKRLIEKGLMFANLIGPPPHPNPPHRGEGGDCTADTATGPTEPSPSLPPVGRVRVGGGSAAGHAMTQITPDTRASAKRLRANSTPQERLVWAGLRDLNRAFGMHFRRQAPIGPFIADFADYTRRLVIEIDGSGHGGDADVARDAYLEAQGFAVLRFWNCEVSGNLEGVLQVVIDALNMAPPPQPSSTGGEGEARISNVEMVADEGTSPPPGGEGSGVGGHKTPQMGRQQ